MEYKGTKYPKEAWSVVRNQTIAITPELSLAMAAEGNPPAKIYNGFSRFCFAVINDAKTPATANIAVEEYENIRVGSHIAQQIDIQSRFSPLPVKAPDTSGNSAVDEARRLASSVRIAMGRLKGKTPLEVLSDNPEQGESDLLTQRDFLNKNLERYPANKEQVNAIEAALKLKKAGKLVDASPVQTPAAGRKIELYKAEYRPLLRKARADGMCPVYHIEISWTVGADYPVTVKITNYYAPVTKNEQGLVNVHASRMDKTTKIDNAMQLSASEWNNALRAMRASMLQFEVLHAKFCVTDAADAEKRNKEAAAKAKQ